MAYQGGILPEMFFRGIVGFILAFCLTSLVSAQPVVLQSQAPLQPKVSITSDQKFLPQSGGEMWVAVKMTIPPGWHTYAPMQGSAFYPPQFKLDPQVGQVRDVKYPTGQTYSAYGKRFPVYFDTTSFLVRIKLGQGRQPTADEIPLSIDWLACTESQCVPQLTTVTVPVRYGPLTPSVYFRDIHRQLSEMPDVPAVPEASQMSWLAAVFLALLGGLVLNLMPCVFPVLSLKVFQVLKNGDASRAAIQREIGFYAAGVLAALWILAFVTIVLRAFGKWAGWGFQLQSPWTVSILALVFVSAGVMMLDWVKLPPTILEAISRVVNRLGLGKSPRHSDAWGSALTGVLAVVAATPCTAPFMGAAITYSLTQSSFLIFLIFTCLGLGLAAPFGLLALFPQWFSKLPKPGAWMVMTKRLLAIPLFLTAIWLVVVASHQFDPVTRSSSVAEVRELIAARQPMLVDVTAEWCLTCKVNEKVLASTKVQRVFRKNNVQLRVLDWTNGDPAVTQFLKQYGRSGVPAYFYFDGKSEVPKPLPQILTPAIVIQSIE